MSLEAVKTIKWLNWKLSNLEIMQMVDKFINLISARYPLGLEGSNEQYFVVPGFEHVTKNQPIIRFVDGEGEWQLSTSTKFLL